MNDTNLPEVNLPSKPDFDTMTAADFEHYLPDFFANSSMGKVSSDPNLQKFLASNPDCAALVRDLEAIGDAARDMFKADAAEPSDTVWDGLQERLRAEPSILADESLK
jgi:uncharacterized protein with HEPN domain